MAGSTPSGLRVSGSAAWLPSCFPMEIAGAGGGSLSRIGVVAAARGTHRHADEGRWRRSTLREAYRRMGQQCLVAAIRLSSDSGRCRLCAGSRRLSCRQQSSATSSIIDVIALIVAAGALVGEATSDAQLSQFRKTPEAKTGVCETGLWRYSRHPNYFSSGFSGAAFRCWPSMRSRGHGCRLLRQP